MAAPHVQVCDCCGCESERLFSLPDSTLWLCVDCFIDLLESQASSTTFRSWVANTLRAAKVAAEAPPVIITDDEAGTEWTIYE